MYTQLLQKGAFQSCPDQRDQPNVALDMHKNAQNVEWKTQSKISYHCTCRLHAKICPSWWCFLRSLLTTSKPSRRSITAVNRQKRRIKEAEKRNSKNLKAWRRRSHSQNFDFCACPSHNVVKRDASDKKGKLLCCQRIFDRIKANLAEIQLKSTKMCKKNAFFAKSSRSQWVKHHMKSR